jgi:hypothetical protein
LIEAFAGQESKGAAMFRVMESTIIAAPPAQVFAVAADPHEQLEWDPGTLKSVEALTPGPLRQGARYRGNFKGFGVMEYDFAEYVPGARFAHHTVMKMGTIRHIFTFEAVSGGTRLRQEGQVSPNLLGRLLRPVMARMLRRRFQVIGAELGQYLAAPAEAPPPSAAAH